MSSAISLSPALARELLYVRAVHPLVLWGLTDLLDARTPDASLLEGLVALAREIDRRLGLVADVVCEADADGDPDA